MVLSSRACSIGFTRGCDIDGIGEEIDSHSLIGYQEGNVHAGKHPLGDACRYAFVSRRGRKKNKSACILSPLCESIIVVKYNQNSVATQQSGATGSADL